MEIKTKEFLKDYTTMRLGGQARFIAEAKTPEILAKLIAEAEKQKLPFFVLGGGSNVIATDQGFDGLIIINKIPGFEVVDLEKSKVLLKLGAGENWDSVVERSVELGLTGIEALSAIPGTTGATPVQNVGAYGQEIADTLVELEAYDTNTNQLVNLTNKDCGFTYRSSIFKNPKNRHHVITSISLHLTKSNPAPPFYESLQKYFDTKNITYFSPKVIREAVIEIRSEKLPDPKIYPNSGSFFKNPIIDKWQYAQLLVNNLDMPGYKMDGSHIKVPAGWLIEHAGMKNYQNHGIKTFENNALVFINVSAQSSADLEAFKAEVAGAVRDKFRIQLEQEPEQL